MESVDGKMQNDQGWIRQGLQLALVECLGPSKTNGAYSKSCLHR
jgi:hypothetical protein